MQDIDWDLLHRYLSGEATPEERARFEAWREASPTRQAFVEALRDAPAEAPALPLLTERDRAETWERLERTIAAAQTVTPFRLAIPSRRRSLVPLAAAAAGLLLFGAVAGGVLWRAHEATSSVAVKTAERVLRTSRGQRATFQFPDGTRVILGPMSTLWYAADYGRRTRDVRVRGEAYFAVAHDERRPFSVRAADLLARDLGTEFVVRAYPEDPRPAVVVRAGEVGIRAAAATDAALRVVAPGELGQLSDQGEPVVGAVDLDPYFAWTQGRLVLDNIPLREALLQLNRWYGIDLRVADSALGRLPVSATLDQRPTAEVLGNMAAALGLTYVEQGTIGYFRRTPSARAD